MKKILKKNKKTISLIVIIAIIYIALSQAVSFYVGKEILKQSKVLHEIGEMPEPQKGQRILVFAPHPDDESIGAGGYIAAATETGAEVNIVLVTDGNKRKLKRIRYQEFKRASRIIGVVQDKLIFLGYPDGSMARQSQDKLKEQFTGIINDKKPDVIISPYFRDDHPDHATVGAIIREIEVGKNAKLYEYVVHQKRFPGSNFYLPKLYLVPPLNLASEPNWKKYILTDQIEILKRNAIRIYRSQMISPEIRDIFFGVIRRNELFLEVKN